MPDIIIYKNKVLQAKFDVLNYKKKAEDIIGIFGDERNRGPRQYPTTSKDNIVHRIKNNIQDIARTNIFSFQITNYPTILPSSDLLSEKFQFLIASASVPPKKITPAKQKYNGVQRRFPNTYDLDPIKVTFYLDKSYMIYKFFNLWMTEISGRSNAGVVGMSYLDDIKATCRLSILDLKKREIYYTVLTEVFPIELSELKYTTNEEKIQTVTVTLSYLDSIQPEVNNYHKQEIEAAASGYFKGLSPSATQSDIQNIISKINKLGTVLNR